MRIKTVICAFALWAAALPLHSMGADALALAEASSHTLQAMRDNVDGAEALVERSAGVLVIPEVAAMRFGEGGLYGEGTLFVQGQPVAYYALAGDDMAQVKAGQRQSRVLVFLTLQALIDFRNRIGWTAGRDGKVVHPDAKALKRSRSLDGPMVGFSFSDAGLLPAVSFAGNQFNRIAR